MLERVLKQIADERSRYEQLVASGQCGDMSDYRDKCGRIAAFNVAESLIWEQIKKEQERTEE